MLGLCSVRVVQSYEKESSGGLRKERALSSAACFASLSFFADSSSVSPTRVAPPPRMRAREDMRSSAPPPAPLRELAGVAPEEGRLPNLREERISDTVRRVPTTACNARSRSRSRSRRRRRCMWSVGRLQQVSVSKRR